MEPSFLPFSAKGLALTKGSGFLTVAEGAVRSAKTTCTLWAWMWDIIKSPDKKHLLLGKDQGSALANCIESEFGLTALSGGGATVKRDHKNRVYVDLFGKHIDVFGGDTVSSYKAFRGGGYGTAYADEANLYHPNTVAEMFNRTIASRFRKHYITLNPDVPSHWLYRDYLDKFEKERTPGYRWFHFTLDDNPAITEERKAELKAQYTGLFYKRFILGLRVRGEGGCYPSFVHNKPGEEGNILDALPAKPFFRVTVGQDYGGNGSATVFESVGFFIDDQNRVCLVIFDELYDDENASTESVIKNWERFAKKQFDDGHGIDRAFGDSAEQLIIKSMNLRPTGVRVENAKKSEIRDRIRLFDTLFAQRRAFVMRKCKNVIEAFENAVWDEKANGDQRLDNGSTKIDPLDAAEYAVERYMKELIEGAA